MTRLGETTRIVPNEIVEVISAPQTIIFWSGAKADVGAAMVMPVPGAFDPTRDIAGTRVRGYGTFGSSTSV